MNLDVAPIAGQQENNKIAVVEASDATAVLNVKCILLLAQLAVMKPKFLSSQVVTAQFTAATASEAITTDTKNQTPSPCVKEFLFINW